jgi:hypothetical protein
LNSRIFGGCKQIIQFWVIAYENTNVVGRRDWQVFLNIFAAAAVPPISATFNQKESKKVKLCSVQSNSVSLPWGIGQLVTSFIAQGDHAQSCMDKTATFCCTPVAKTQSYLSNLILCSVSSLILIKAFYAMFIKPASLRESSGVCIPANLSLLRATLPMPASA